MATQVSKRRGPAAAVPRKHVMTSVRLDVATHARLSAAAALAGMDKSTFCARAISEALIGIVVFDRRKPDGQLDPSGEVDRASVA